MVRGGSRLLRVATLSALAVLGALLWAAPASGAFGFITKFGSSGTGNGQFNLSLHGIATDPDSNVYVLDLNRVQKFTTGGTFITKWGTPGSGNGQFGSPTGITVDNVGNVYVADSTNGNVQKFNAAGAFISKWSSPSPMDVAADNAGNVYVLSRLGVVEKRSSTGALLDSWNIVGGEPTSSGHGIATNGTDVLVSTSYTMGAPPLMVEEIQRFDSAGNLITKWGTFGTGNGQFDGIRGVDVDRFGGVWTTELSNPSRGIQKFNQSGQFQLAFGSFGAGNGQFDEAADIASDCRGAVYVADGVNRRVQKLGDSALPSPTDCDTTVTINFDFQSLKKLILSVTCPWGDCAFGLKGKLRVPVKRGAGADAAKSKGFKVKQKSLTVPGAVETTVGVKLKNNKRKLKQVRKLRKQSKKARKGSKLKLTLTATGQSSDTTKLKETFKLKK